MRIIPLPDVTPPYSRPPSPAPLQRPEPQPIQRGRSQELLAPPSTHAYLLEPACVPSIHRVTFSPPIADVPTPDEMAHQFPDMPVRKLTQYATAHYLTCVAQLDYSESYRARGQFWKHVNEMKGIWESLLPPPPYRP